MAITGQTSNVVHPRIGELRDLGYLKEIGNKKIDGRNHAILKITEQGDKIDTSGVKDITPAKRYYSKEDYKRFCREFYDFMQVSTPTNTQNLSALHKNLVDFLATKK